MTSVERLVGSLTSFGSGRQYETALIHLLPSNEHTSLLVACLCEPQFANSAWDEFVRVVGDPKIYFEVNRTGLKGLLPFVESRLAANSIDAGKTFHTYARVAAVREDLRRRIYIEILEATLDAFGRAGISALLLKGGAISETVYPKPSWRHNHAIDLLIDEKNLVQANRVLSDEKFKRGPQGFGAAHHDHFRHATGLAMGLHSKALYLPHFELPMNEIALRSQTIKVGGVPARVMAPEDCLIHVCGHAIYSRSRSNLRWVCDAFYLLQRNPSFRWDVLTRTAARSRLALPLLVLLQWFELTFGNRVPGEVLAELADDSARVDAATSEGIYAALLHTSRSRREALRWTRGSVWTTVGFLKFSAWPSRRYLAWRHNVRLDLRLLYLYPARALKFVARSMRSCLARALGGRERIVGHRSDEGALP